MSHCCRTPGSGLRLCALGTAGLLSHSQLNEGSRGTPGCKLGRQLGLPAPHREG